MISATWTRDLKAIATASALDSPGVLLGCSTGFLMDTLVALTDAGLDHRAVLAELERRAAR